MQTVNLQPTPELTGTPPVGSGSLLGRVYVDAAVWKYGRMTMCHMIADNLDALHAMADKIGVARCWFQNKPGFPHYDICKTKREMAVRFGATEISWRELVAKVKRPNNVLCNHPAK